MATIKRAHLLANFVCLGEKCEDTCCQSWSMQVDERTHQLYEQKAPELLDAITPSEESPWIMRRNADTGMCVKLEGGLCGIHKQYGDNFLSDACHFYPRVTRTLGSQVLMTASLSCPEIARIALFEDAPCVKEAWEEERLPTTMKNYLPEDMDEETALKIHQAFLDATEDASASAEQILLRISSVSRSLERIERKSWPVMVPFYLQHADTRIPAAEKNLADPFNLLHSLCGLIVASHRVPSSRLRGTIEHMEKALHVTLDWEKVEINTQEDSLTAYVALLELWDKEAGALFAPVLRRWLQMQMSIALYPFSGLGHTLTERITLIGVRLAIIKLALLCNFSSIGPDITQDVVVRVVQSLSRFLDHLGDAEFSLRMYAETGWIKEGRLRAILEK